MSFDEYISDSENSIDSNYPSWPCLYKKKDRSICRKDTFTRTGVSNTIGLHQKKYAHPAKPIYKKNWLES